MLRLLKGFPGKRELRCLGQLHRKLRRKRVLASAVGASALSLFQKLEVTSAKAGEGCPHLGYASGKS